MWADQNAMGEGWIGSGGGYGGPNQLPVLAFSAIQGDRDHVPDHHSHPG